MKRIFFCILTLLFINQASFAGTANIFEGISATLLKDKLIKLYTLEGAHVDNYLTNTNSFTISKNNLSYGMNTRFIYDYTLVQDSNNKVVVSLAMSAGIGAYGNSASLTSQEQAELDRVKGKILGYYSYGLAYPQKIYFYTEYNEDGILEQKNVLAASQRILGLKLTATKYDAKAQGLYIGDRIKKINGIKVSKYKRADLASVLKPNSRNDEIEITYKRGTKLNNAKIKATFVKPEANL